MKKIPMVLIGGFLAVAGFLIGKQQSPVAVHADSQDAGRYSLFRTDADTNFYDRGVFFLDTASGAVYRYDWDKKELIEVPKVGAGAR